MKMVQRNKLLQLTQRERRGGHRCVPWPGSLADLSHAGSPSYFTMRAAASRTDCTSSGGSTTTALPPQPKTQR